MPIKRSLMICLLGVLLAASTRAGFGTATSAGCLYGRPLYNVPMAELAAMLADNSSKDRVPAALEMGLRGDKAAIPVLKRALSDSVVRIRVVGADALSKLGDKSGIPTLKDALTCGDEFWALDAACALARNGDQSGREIIDKTLHSPDWARRSLALRASQYLPGCAPIDALKAAMDDDHAVLRILARDIAADHSTPATEALMRGYLRTGDAQQRDYAISALGRSHPRENFPLLIEMLTDADLNVRSTALFMLGKITGRQLTPMAIVKPESTAATRAKWEKWWSENKDKPLPSQPASSASSAGQPGQ